MLAYAFWHWRQPDVSRETYEARQREFHEALAAHPPEGFLRWMSLPAERDGHEREAEADDGRDQEADGLRQVLKLAATAAVVVLTYAIHCGPPPSCKRRRAIAR